MSSTRLLDATNARNRLATEHLVPSIVLDRIGPATSQGGLLIGFGPQGKPLTMSMFRSMPTRIVLVGGLYLARQLVLRAAAAGTWVTIATGRPADWEVLVHATDTAPGANMLPVVQLRRLVSIELPLTNPDNPLLVVHDGGATPAELFPPHAAWQTTLTVLPYLHPQASTVANNADLVLMQRLQPAEAQTAGQIWRLRPAMIQELTTLKDDRAIILGRDLWLPLQLTTAAAEQRLLGPIRRGD